MIAKGRLVAALSACAMLLSSAAAHAGERATDISRLERDVLTEINYARQHPREYAETLRDYRRYFDGRVLFLPGDPNGVITNEGLDAVDEAIDFLERQDPLPALSRAELLMLAAQDHADDQGAYGGSGHVSRDGLTPGDRVKRRGGDIYVGEGIWYGNGDAGAVVRSLIVDDGVRSRGHRALLFQADFRFAGVGCGAHRRFGNICVVDFSGTADGSPVVPAWAKARGGQVFRMPATTKR
ncbi:CAP domain-containing protein [Sphingomonas sp. HITSZ_GF]|uniref:CAP domain-containing protein n=1 Tax=Sphingomonas sp. HITSZ_GF TaxID=3037247 RepID=UPI00240D845F|nr:CAP domain-containing protein [Sphingomonas sp. HITSZ_GF]MDG2532582.1 CAP domain-containing protein [Sphingomonas sp. HITSZ_GF]